MLYKPWLYSVPVFLLLGAGGHVLLNPQVTRGSDGRIVDAQFYSLEREAGHHVYAPTWLPYRGRVGNLGAMRGAKRILQDFVDRHERSLCILSQEKRSQRRDGYHRRLFQDRMEATADINGTPGYFVTGDSGERRLFWNAPECAVILSSAVLTDQEMADVARKVR